MVKPPVEEIKSEETAGFDTKCKFEFPVFVAPQPQPQQVSSKLAKSISNDKKEAQKPANKTPNTSFKAKKIDSTNAWEKQNQNPFLYYSTENKVSKKALNEEFPSLAGDNTEKGINFWKKNDKLINLWKKRLGGGQGGGNDYFMEDKKEEEIYEEEDNKVIGKKGKGKNKKVIYSGGFYWSEEYQWG